MKALVCLYMVDIKIAHDRRDMCCNISNTDCTDTTKLPNTSTSIRRMLLLKGCIKKLSCSLSIYTNKYNKK